MFETVLSETVFGPFPILSRKRCNFWASKGPFQTCCTIKCVNVLLRFFCFLLRKRYKPSTLAKLLPNLVFRGQKNRTRKKNKFLGTEVPRNFSDQCSLDFAYFSVFSVGGGPKVPRNFVPGNFFFLSYFRWFFSFRVF